MIKRSAKKVPVHYGMPDFYKYYIKNTEKPVSYTKFSTVISTFNKEVIDQVLNKYKDYLLPHLRLKLSVRKSKPRIRIKNGVVINNSPIDWPTTKKLWKYDEEAKSNKTLVRFLNKDTFGYVFKIYGVKFGARFKYKSAFKFKANRDFKRALGRRIKNKNKDRFDSYLLYKNQ